MQVPSYRKIWIISYPIILSLLAQNIIGVVDTAFLGRVGEVELGASAIGGLFYHAIFMLGFGFGTGAQILIARRKGEGHLTQIGKIFDHTMYIFAAFSVIIIVFTLWLSPKFLGYFMSSQAVFHASVRYLDYRIWGILFAFTNVAFRAYYVGITHTGLLGWSAAIMAIINILLDYALIFGNWGFPEMGIEGAALASVIAEGVSAAFFILLTLTNPNNQKYHIFRLPRFNKEIIRRTWNISVFIMLQNFVSLSAWFMFFMVIEQTGERPLAISNIIRSLYLLLMIHVWSFSASVNSLVSNVIGEGNSNYVFPIIKKVNLMGMSISLGIIAISLLIPETLLKLYTNDQGLIQDALPVLYVVIFALIPLAVSINWFSGVSGTANTKVALLIEVSTILIYLAYVFITILVMDASLPVVWISEYVYVSTLGLFSFLYLKFGKWRGRKI
jgi:putative MATE family efflux protein